MTTSAPIAVIIVAAGKGQRARPLAGDRPKQYALIAGKPLLRWTIDAVLSAMPISVADIHVVIGADDRALFDQAAAGLGLAAPIIGGQTRQQSVLAGLEALADRGRDLVLVHDAARPFVEPSIVNNVLTALTEGAISVVPAIRPVDTLRMLSGDLLERDQVAACQTPQGFDFSSLLAAHRAAAAAGRHDFSDDAAVMAAVGHETVFVAGGALNTKITHGDDLIMAGYRLGADRDIRTGQGYDVHRLVAGAPLWLGGLNIPHHQGLSGHSDADVALHALTDAVLGAIADGDIGRHFPPSDPTWKGARSDQFLAFAVRRVQERGGRIANLDLTIIAEAPKIGPHADAMRDRIADIAEIDPSRVSVKATTSERLGFTGRSEGIAAMALATVSLPVEVS